ncbi:MAG: LysR family transcriptional regulator [Pseudomonadales bacterium]|nr:LysR family transcriptional regulator [Pseudomonadales bacterium]
MRLKGLDLNLLVALDILLEERSVSRTAERLHLSQPAVSAALARLRSYFQDDLLVLHGKRLIPTSYAEVLMPAVKRVIQQADDLVAMSAEFDPVHSERFFRLMSSDYIATVLLSPAISLMQKLAPAVKIDIRLPEDALLAKFEIGEIDLMLVPEGFLSNLHPAELLFEEPHVVAGWKGNPIFDRKITREAFFDASHISIAIGPNSAPSFTERNMEKMGYKRHIDIHAPNFSSVPWLLANTNRLAVIQERLAKQFASVFPLKFAPLPFEFPSMRMMLQYHATREKDQGLTWLRQFLLKTAKTS